MTNKEAIKILKSATMFKPTIENTTYPEAFDMAIKALEERPEGEWIITHHKDILGRWNSWYEYKCSVCKHSVSQMHDDAYEEYATKFCPNCGAAMRKGDAE